MVAIFLLVAGWSFDDVFGLLVESLFNECGVINCFLT